jgi:hypothetical protein
MFHTRPQKGAINRDHWGGGGGEGGSQTEASVEDVTHLKSSIQHTLEDVIH